MFQAIGYMVLHINDDPTVDGTCGNDSATLGIKYNDRQWFNLTLTKVIHLARPTEMCYLKDLSCYYDSYK